MSTHTRRPSPALIISMIALVAAFAGSAFALPGKNSVTSNDIKKNAVRSSDVKNDSLKGKDIKESTLGKVPSAEHADTAGNLEGQTRVAQFVTAGTHELATFGPFRLVGECVVDAGGDDANLLIETSTDDSILQSEDTDEDDFDVADNPLTIIAESAANGDPDLDGATDSLTAIAADGTTVTSGDYFAGINVAGIVGQCYFGGTFEQLR